MYILTTKGNYIPIENVDFIKPRKEGSLILLKSGRTSIDSRTPLEIFEQMTPISNNNVLATSIYKELKQVKQEVVSLVTEVVEITKTLNTAMNKLTHSSVIAEDSAKSVKSSIYRVEKIIEVVDEAIKEAVND